MSTKNKKFGSALQDALVSHNENVEIPKKYLIALLLCQEFEFRLRLILLYSIETVKSNTSNSEIKYDPKIPEYWNANNYINKIKEFFPEDEYGSFYKAIKTAKQKRNQFIHNSFTISQGNFSFVNLDFDKFYLHEKSQKITDEWFDSYILAAKEISNLMQDKFKGIKLKVI